MSNDLEVWTTRNGWFQLIWPWFDQQLAFRPHYNEYPRNTSDEKCKIHIEKFDPYNFRCLNRFGSKLRCFYTYSHMYTYIYIHTFFWIYKQVYVYIFSDIIYTPAQRFVLHNFSLHSWCFLKKKPGCRSRAFAWLCAVTWTEMQRNIPSCLSLVDGQTQWLKNKDSSTWNFVHQHLLKLFKWNWFECVVFVWSQVGGKMRTWLPKFGTDRWKLFWQLVIYSMSTGVMIENIAGQAILLLWSIFAWFCLYSDKLRITLIIEFSCS